VSAAPEINADDSLISHESPWQEVWAQFKGLRRGDSGMVPIVVGIVVLVGYFQIRNSLFLSAGNLVNLFVQATTFVLLGMAEIWLLLLGDIDLSVGYVSVLGGATAVILGDGQFHWPWFLTILMAVVVTTAIGALHGAITILLRVPSFIVTLAGLLAWEGVLIYVVDAQGTGGTISDSSEKVLYDLVNTNMSTLWTIITLAVCVGGSAFVLLARDRARRRNGLTVLPFVITVIKIVAMIVAGAVLVSIFNTNRGVTFAGHRTTLEGMPWAILVDIVMLAGGSLLLSRTKTGRYLYAIGGNAEAARRAGVSVNRYRLLAFMLTGFTTGIAGLLYISRQGGVSDNVDSTLVLYAVAAAVIGGTSLFGGRGKIIHALIGGLIVAIIYNGMGLLSITASAEYIAIAVVLLAAVTVDSLARRGSTV
jgi:D-xylose transport system permease protein